MDRTAELLIIEDDENDYVLLSNSCKNLGFPFNFNRYATGETGLAALLQTKTTRNFPDVVIVDIALPGIPGYVILNRIRSDPDLRFLTVIMLTGRSTAEDQEACASADYYVVKPQTLPGWNEVAARIAAFCSNGREEPPVGKSQPIDAAPHILHIDDNESDRTLFSLAFAKSGLSGVLHSLASSSEALLYLNRLPPYAKAPAPRLIILDLSLPRVDGRTLLKHLKSNSRFRSIPVIVLTGSENYADISQCRKLGVEDYVVKPHSAQELIELISSFDHWLAKPPSGMPIS